MAVDLYNTCGTNAWIDKGGEGGGGGPWVLWHDSFPHTTNRLGSHTLFVERLWKMKAPLSYLLVLAAFLNILVQNYWQGTQVCVRGYLAGHSTELDFFALCAPRYQILNEHLHHHITICVIVHYFFHFSILPMDGGALIWKWLFIPCFILVFRLHVRQCHIHDKQRGWPWWYGTNDDWGMRVGQNQLF